MKVILVGFVIFLVIIVGVMYMFYGFLLFIDFVEDIVEIFGGIFRLFYSDVVVCCYEFEVFVRDDYFFYVSVVVFIFVLFDYCC